MRATITFLSAAAIAGLAAASPAPQQLDFAQITAAPTVQSGPSGFALNQTMTIQSSFDVTSVAIASTTQAATKRDLHKRAFGLLSNVVNYFIKRSETRTLASYSTPVVVYQTIVIDSTTTVCPVTMDSAATSNSLNAAAHTPSSDSSHESQTGTTKTATDSSPTTTYTASTSSSSSLSPKTPGQPSSNPTHSSSASHSTSVTLVSSSGSSTNQVQSESTWSSKNTSTQRPSTSLSKYSSSSAQRQSSGTLLSSQSSYAPTTTVSSATGNSQSRAKSWTSTSYQMRASTSTSVPPVQSSQSSQSSRSASTLLSSSTSPSHLPSAYSSQSSHNPTTHSTTTAVGTTPTNSLSTYRSATWTSTTHTTQNSTSQSHSSTPATSTKIQSSSSTSTTSSGTACPTKIEAGTYCGFINPEDPCAPQPGGYGPVSKPDTVKAFRNNPEFQADAKAAPPKIPSSDTGAVYNQIFRDFNASVNAASYLGVYTLMTYNTSECAAICDKVSLCTAFNFYIERDPSVNPSANDSTAPTVYGYWCPNPPSITNYKCSLWGSSIRTAQAVNYGEMREQFHTVITASNGYDKTNSSIPKVSAPASSSSKSAPYSPAYASKRDAGPSAPSATDTTASPSWATATNLNDKAINSPKRWMGSNFFPGPFNAQMCADYAWQQNSVSEATAVAQGLHSFMPVKYFNAYYLRKNGDPYGTYCNLYSATIDSSYATFEGSWSGSDYYAVTQSWGFSLEADTSFGTC